MAWIVLLLFCLYLGVYFALFAFLVSLTQRATGSTVWTLLLTPVLWTAVELARARITSFPWNQLGDSQIDNLLLTRLAPWMGTYGISFVLIAGNCAVASFFLFRDWRARLVPPLLAILLAAGLWKGYALHIPPETTHATAILLQPNLNVEGVSWVGNEFDKKMQYFAALSEKTCSPYYSGLPLRGKTENQPDCKLPRPPIDVIVWPESPAPFIDTDPRFRHWISALAEDAHSPVIVGDVGLDRGSEQSGPLMYNSASFVASDGTFVGRYDKMHLVPFGEYTPFPKLLSFAGSLTDQVGHMTPGRRRVVFAFDGHRYGVVICYESIFADEVRQFVKLGADALVNISDDGWYGDTSAPWQHLNMTRMRAIENDRWVLIDTNSGVTAVVDPYGRVVESAPRHTETSLLGHFNDVSRQTFYTRHGDLFAWLCAIIAIVLTVDGGFQNNYQPRTKFYYQD